MGFRAVCIESRCRCSYMGGYLVVAQDEETAKIHLSEISSLTFCTTQVYVSAYLLSELAKSKIPVVFCDEKCFPVAESLPLHGAHNCSAHVAEQLEWSLPAKKRLWQRVVRDKIRMQSAVLRDLGQRAEADALVVYAEDVRSGDPTNREAAAAGLYFSALFGEGFTRDSDTSINAALNYGYSILLSKVNREIVSRGYVTQVGVFHRGGLNQWNLACDLMEPFRPFVDYVVITSGLDSFDKPMRHLLIDMMNRIVSYKDGQYKMNSVVSLYVKECLDSLGKKIAVEDIAIYALS